MPVKFLVSPTSHDVSDAFGDDCIVSLITEAKGADVLIYSEAGLMGIQIKAIPNDFISSFTDGRLARAIPLLRESCTFARILGQGRFHYYPDTTVDLGRFKDKKRIPTRFTKAHVKGMINDIELIHGIMIDWTEDLDDTIHYLKCMRQYLSDKSHLGLYRRPKAVGAWIVPSSRDIELWILQSFPGIGPTTADKIIKFFGGVVPMRWACTVEQLAMIPGISRSKAAELWKYLPAGELEMHPELAKTTSKPSVINRVEYNSEGFVRMRRLLRRA